MINIMLLEPLLMQKYSKHFDECAITYNKHLTKFSVKLTGAKVRSSDFLTECLGQILFGRKSGEYFLSKRRTFIFLASGFKAKNFFRKSEKIKRELKLK